MKISLDAGRPDGEWTSWNENCGTGDGTKTVFPLPFPAKEARGLLVTRDFGTVEPDGVLVTFGKDEEGKTVSTKEPDGWRLDEAAAIVFDKPPRYGAKIAVSCLGRPVGDAFKVYAMDPNLQRRFDEKTPKEIKLRKPNEAASLPAVREMTWMAFIELVQDWKGITDGDGNPLPCDATTKKLFMEKTDISFGLFVMERARAIQRERLAGFETAVQD